MAHFVLTTEKTSAEEVAKLFQDNIQKLYGLPESIIIDRRAQSIAGIIKELNSIMGIDTKLLTAYHPQIDRQTERMNQKLEQYLRMFIDHRWKQWPDWLVMVEFAYDNKVQTSTKVSPFKTNIGQDLYMGFEIRKKGKFEKVEEFVTRIKEVHKEAKAVLRKSQEEIRKYVDRKRSEAEEYQVEDQVLLSTKDLKYQMQERRSEKLMERFVKPYQVKKIISTNAIELDLLSTVKIHLVVNVSRVCRYKDQAEGQRKEQPSPVIIDREEEYEVKKILNKRKLRGKDRYVVQQKGYITEEDTWEPRENLGNAQDLVDKFEEEYREGIRQIKKRNSRKDYKRDVMKQLPRRKLFLVLSSTSKNIMWERYKQCGKDYVIYVQFLVRIM